MNYQISELPTPISIEVARNCSCLINVASQMAKDWISQKDNFRWVPRDTCAYTKELIAKFDFDGVELLWSEFNKNKEPFGFIVPLKNSNTAYLVFRGSQTVADFFADAQVGQVEYVNGGKVSKGFYRVFNGLEKLQSALKAIKVDNLVICGHSLGSTLATLSVPVAIESGFSPDLITVFPQASPKVGDQDFANYINALGVKLFRLVNTEDSVPNAPRDIKDTRYVHVGDEVSFTAKYNNESLNHNPCCSYAYALLHPESPVNPENNGDNCIFPNAE